MSFHYFFFLPHPLRLALKSALLNQLIILTSSPHSLQLPPDCSSSRSSNHIAQRPVPTPMTILSVKFSHSRQALILDTRISDWTTDLRDDISTAVCITSSLLILIVAVAIRRGCLNKVLLSSTMIKTHFFR